MRIIATTKKYRSHEAAREETGGTLVQLLKKIGVTSADLDTHTYLYINDDHQIVACSMSDRRSAEPADQSEMLGYVTAMGSIADLKRSLK